MKSNKLIVNERRRLDRHKSADKWSDAATRSGDFKAYQLSIMHNWLGTMTLMGVILVPFFLYWIL